MTDTVDRRRKPEMTAAERDWLEQFCPIYTGLPRGLVPFGPPRRDRQVLDLDPQEALQEGGEE